MNEPIYIEGDPGTECPSETSKTSDGLCGWFWSNDKLHCLGMQNQFVFVVFIVININIYFKGKKHLQS